MLRKKVVLCRLGIGVSGTQRLQVFKPITRGAMATKASKARALPKFWVTVNPISTRGADYAHHSTMGLVWLHFAVAPLITWYATTTVGINPILSDLNTPGTSKLGWRYFVAYKIDWNKLQIRKSSQKGTGTKIAEKLNNFESFGRKRNQISPMDLQITGQIP